MLPVFVSDLPASIAAGKIFHPPDGPWTIYLEMLLRWIHFLAGITWIGLLYFFNFVNGSLMKALDGPTKAKVTPQLMPRALWWFRWGAVITVLAGLTYYIRIIEPDPGHWGNLGIWLLIVLVTYAIIFAVLRPVSGALNNGWIIAVIVGALVSAMAFAILKATGGVDVSNKTLSIGIGGGIGLLMFLNVWGIIWPHQKRIIAWGYDNAEKGTPVPAENAKMVRRAFLASRMNTWLSVPMLFFMAASSHLPGLFGK